MQPSVVRHDAESLEECGLGQRVEMLFLIVVTQVDVCVAR